MTLQMKSKSFFFFLQDQPLQFQPQLHLPWLSSAKLELGALDINTFLLS